ncbi:hypothetical protein B0T17DRAFT_511899 [Bombardia bombarda]|uniref:Uncharacterized protein n=1 Tax=Bombardia bombarda TaxID=252184 RepID=A0AA39W418_9PEZI|nr:hypothetical protein B0T17DRAFT_511899 [Bombardia bombarda]
MPILGASDRRNVTADWPGSRRLNISVLGIAATYGLVLRIIFNLDHGNGVRGMFSFLAAISPYVLIAELIGAPGRLGGRLWLAGVSSRGVRRIAETTERPFRSLRVGGPPPQHLRGLWNRTCLRRGAMGPCPRSPSYHKLWLPQALVTTSSGYHKLWLPQALVPVEDWLRSPAMPPGLCFASWAQILNQDRG